MHARLALLRGINVAGKKKVPMAELRQLADGLGWQQVATYIASGNVVYTSSASAADDEGAMQAALEAHFGFEVVVVVRSAARWTELAGGGAFPEAERDREKLLHLAMSKSAPLPDAAERLEPYLDDEEAVAVIEDGLWIDFANGAGRSRLSPAVLDRCIGSTVTARNWRTVRQLAEMLAHLE